MSGPPDLYIGGVHQPLEVGHGGVYTGPLPARQIATEYGQEQGAPGLHMRHEERHEMWKLIVPAPLSNGLAVGAVVVPFTQLGFLAKSVIVWNNSGYDLLLDGEYPIPTGFQNYVMLLYPTLQTVEVKVEVAGQSAASGRLRMVFCESILPPTPGTLPLSWAR